MISCKIVFPINSNSVQRRHERLANPFILSIMFVIKAVFISEKITNDRFGALLETNKRFSTKLNVFSYRILQFSLNSLKNFITILYEFEKQSGKVVLLESP